MKIIEYRLAYMEIYTSKNVHQNDNATLFENIDNEWRQRISVNHNRRKI